MTDTRLLYTVGYQQTALATLTLFLERERALLADIRFAPWSENEMWREYTLRAYFGARYLHVRELGNPNYKNGEPMRLADGRAGLRIIAKHLRQQPVVLMCACWNLDGCHRKLAAEYIRAEYSAANVPLEVVHLTGALLRGRPQTPVQLSLMEPPQ